MKVAVYFDKDKLDLKYFDEIKNLEKGLIETGHEIVKLDYRELQAMNVCWADRDNPEIGVEAYILTPGGMAAKEKFMQHLNLKDAKYHNKPVILYDFDEDFTSINRYMLQWCEDSGVIPGKVMNWWAIVTSVKEVVNLIN